MPTYYVSPFGSDSNTGLATDGSDDNLGNGPFLTLQRAIGASGLAGPGDTVYVAPGVYRANTTVGVQGTSGNPISIIGDPGNAHGFTDDMGNLLSAGEVRCTSYTVNDSTAPTNGSVLSMNNKSYFSFSNIWFVGGVPNISGQGNIYIYGGSHNIDFTACIFSQGVSLANSYGVLVANNTSSQLALNLTIDRCVFMSLGVRSLFSTLARTSSGVSDYSAGVTVRNTLFVGGDAQIYLASSGAGALLGGGFAVTNCTFAFANNNASIVVADGGVSSTSPTNGVNVQNSLFLRANAQNLNANSNGQILEDYNHFTGGRVNIAPLVNSTADGFKCLMLDIGQWMLWGQQVRPFLTPTIGSPQLGFGGAPGAPSYDWMNRARPEGGGSLSSAIGYVERHDTAVKDTEITDTGSVSIRIDGPGSHEFLIPVDETATTIAVKCYFDANHGTATPPQATLTAATEIGVAAQTVTAPAIIGQWQTLTFSEITPTAKGVVRVILASRPSTADGKAYFDTFSVS